MMSKSIIKAIVLLAVSLLSIGISASCSKDSGKGESKGPDDEVPVDSVTAQGTKMKHMLGINGFEWDFLGMEGTIAADRTALIHPFYGFRHYLDWYRIETLEGEYAYQPTLSGNWDFDDIYRWCKDHGIEVLACLKNVPDWLQNTYPEQYRHSELAPLPYGSDRTDPASYIQMGKLAFQFAARYGNNTVVDPALVSVVAKPHWAPNQKEIGLGLVTYMECNNEPDKTWMGELAEQTPEAYAANLSAFYDGHKGTLGADVGAKTADPHMMVVMGGLATGSPEYLQRMVDWCRQHRGLTAEGKVDLCFDIINYHHYSFNESSPSRGTAPELSTAAAVAKSVVDLANDASIQKDVWITELGYDIHQGSPLKAIAIGGKSAEVTQADWSLRSALLYARQGIKRLHFYMLHDAVANSATQFSTSGFVSPDMQPRPALNYFAQVQALMGDYAYQRTIGRDPLVDVYVYDEETMFVLVVPDEVGREEDYELDLGDVAEVFIHQLSPHTQQVSTRKVRVVDGRLNVTVTETPLFVEPVK